MTELFLSTNATTPCRLIPAPCSNRIHDDDSDEHSDSPSQRPATMDGPTSPAGNAGGYDADAEEYSDTGYRRSTTTTTKHNLRMRRRTIATTASSSHHRHAHHRRHQRLSSSHSHRHHPHKDHRHRYWRGKRSQSISGSFNNSSSSDMDVNIATMTSLLLPSSSSSSPMMQHRNKKRHHQSCIMISPPGSVTHVTSTQYESSSSSSKASEISSISSSSSSRHHHHSASYNTAMTGTVATPLLDIPLDLTGGNHHPNTTTASAQLLPPFAPSLWQQQQQLPTAPTTCVLDEIQQLQPSTKRRRLLDPYTTPLSFLSSTSNLLRPTASCNKQNIQISTQCYNMEMALELSTKAHLIIEACHPYRIVHANAAFHRLVLPPPPPPAATVTSTSTATTTTSQNTLDMTQLSEDIQSTFGNRIVTLYPVCSGSSSDASPRHYLLEVSMENIATIGHPTLDQPALTVA